jgi:hypothetical protein
VAAGGSHPFGSGHAPPLATESGLATPSWAATPSLFSIFFLKK